MLSAIDQLLREYGTQASLAAALGIRASAISNWKRKGISDAMKWRLLRLASARGIELSPETLDGLPASETPDNVPPPCPPDHRAAA